MTSPFVSGGCRCVGDYDAKLTEMTRKPFDNKRPQSRRLSPAGSAWAHPTTTAIQPPRKPELRSEIAAAQRVSRSKPSGSPDASDHAVLHTRSMRSFLDLGSGGGAMLANRS